MDSPADGNLARQASRRRRGAAPRAGRAAVKLFISDASAGTDGGTSCCRCDCGTQRHRVYRSPNYVTYVDSGSNSIGSVTAGRQTYGSPVICQLAQLSHSFGTFFRADLIGIARGNVRGWGRAWLDPIGLRHVFCIGRYVFSIQP
jgi:hypothetical protein